MEQAETSLEQRPTPRKSTPVFSLRARISADCPTGLVCLTLFVSEAPAEQKP